MTIPPRQEGPTGALLHWVRTRWPMLTMHLAMGVLFLCLALLFAALMGWFGGVTWLLVWPALSLLIVGAGYLGLGPGVIGKRRDGTLPLVGALPVLPYLGVAAVMWYAIRVLGDEDPYNEIARGLFLGRRVHHWEMPPHTRVVLDMTAEFVEPMELRRECHYLCLPTLDASAPRVEDLVQLVREALSFDGNVFVHCAAGHGRSAMVVAVLLVMRSAAADVDEAITLMKRARPRVDVRSTQRRVAREAIRRLREGG